VVTILEADEDGDLAEPGDDDVALLDYEDRLARGEIVWQ
jgi:hypothetical protein